VTADTNQSSEKLSLKILADHLRLSPGYEPGSSPARIVIFLEKRGVAR
jgi:hypothetical protein